MTRPPLDPRRLQSFALAYGVAVREVIKERRLWLDEMSPEEFALQTTLDMVAALERGGVKAIEHYYINTCGAIAATCRELGIESSSESLGAYLAGR